MTVNRHLKSTFKLILFQILVCRLVILLDYCITGVLELAVVNESSI